MTDKKNYVQPNFIVGSDGKKVIVDVNKWHGEQRAKITVKDLVDYYVESATDEKSMVRTIGDITGHWKDIDDLAKELLKHFKETNPHWLKHEAKKNGLKLL